MRAIYRVGGRLDLALTIPDDRGVTKSGRVYLDEFCGEHAIPLVKVRNINDPEAVEAIRQARIDWLFIIGWSQIARTDVLAAPRNGVLGMHPTLLPQGRGRAAIPWAIIKGLERTGVTMFKLDQGVDTGEIVDQVVIELSERTDAGELYRAVDAAHVTLMETAFPKLLNGTIQLRKQSEDEASEWPGRTPEDGRIDLAGSVRDAERLVRATTRPYPGAFIVRDGRKLIVWRAALAESDGDGELLPFRDGELRLIETEDGGPMAVTDQDRQS
jgi:methionyl-tRNA formyltransferase